MKYHLAILSLLSTFSTFSYAEDTKLNCEAFRTNLTLREVQENVERDVTLTILKDSYSGNDLEGSFNFVGQKFRVVKKPNDLNQIGSPATITISTQVNGSIISSKTAASTDVHELSFTKTEKNQKIEYFARCYTPEVKKRILRKSMGLED